jgi:hypothetical protein
MCNIVFYKSKNLLGGIFSLLIVWLIDEYVDTVSTVHDNETGDNLKIKIVYFKFIVIFVQ